MLTAVSAGQPILECFQASTACLMKECPSTALCSNDLQLQWCFTSVADGMGLTGLVLREVERALGRWAGFVAAFPKKSRCLEPPSWQVLVLQACRLGCCRMPSIVLLLLPHFYQLSCLTAARTL